MRTQIRNGIKVINQIRIRIKVMQFRNSAPQGLKRFTQEFATNEISLVRSKRYGMSTVRYRMCTVLDGTVRVLDGTLRVLDGTLRVLDGTVRVLYATVPVQSE
jgi:hypothetical protein